MDWFIFTMMAVFFFGIQSFLYKSASESKTNKYLVTLVFMITVEVLAIIAFFLKGMTITNLIITLILGFLFAVFFYLRTIFQFKALEHLPTNKVFPISSGTIIVTFLYGIIVFKDSVNALKILGVLLIILAINLIHNNSKKSEDYDKKKIGFLFAFLSIIPGAGMVITNKYTALNTDLNFFIVVTYMFSVLISFTSHSIAKEKTKKYDVKKSILFGILIGIFNFSGFFSVLTAMKTGPLSVVAPVITTNAIITIILSKIVHKEELTLKQFGFVMLSIVGIILLKI